MGHQDRNSSPFRKAHDLTMPNESTWVRQQFHGAYLQRIPSMHPGWKHVQLAKTLASGIKTSVPLLFSFLYQRRRAHDEHFWALRKTFESISWRMYLDLKACHEAWDEANDSSSFRQPCPTVAVVEETKDGAKANWQSILRNRQPIDLRIGTLLTKSLGCPKPIRKVLKGIRALQLYLCHEQEPQDWWLAWSTK